ncbi:RNA-binding domain-containing protein [Algoriphagus pacificus]|uniref:DNA binding domain-containing protein n=1 Tax=Algoriphagus pacificus TaxID=2811234 RepID=A0ABS3CKR8_9BACT|nr:RNA-binding domain-containing protein [Algoriphagus pacificus]MBN7816249.1 putative DNA binding domain-containing protein [Algoriphagus pacificus]
MNRTVSFIAELIQQKESIQIEFVGEYKVSQILKVICSFLNTEGGWVLVGYDGKEFRGISGGIENKVSELKNLIFDQIFPQPLVDVRFEKYKSLDVLLINVIKGSRQPYTYEKKYFVRKGRQTQEATTDEISLLLRTSNEYASTWEKQTAIDATLEDLVQNEIELTISDANKIGRGKSLPNDMSGFLSYFQLVDMSLIRNGSIVLFGKDPVKFISQCQIRITLMPHGKTGSRFDDTVLIEDNLFAAFNRIEEYFTRNLPMISEFKYDKWNRKNEEKYPMDALREAVLNAMVHRDYADISGDITINIYPDKMEIINSGEIPPDIISGKNNIKEHHSVLRNPTIAHLFYLRGKIEKLGRGLSLIKDRFVENGLKVPEWTSQSGYTTLTLYGFSKPIGVNDRMLTFMKKLKVGEQFSREDFERFFESNISEKTARNDIGKLMEGRWVERIGEGPSTKYVRTNKELPEITG